MNVPKLMLKTHDGPGRFLSALLLLVFTVGFASQAQAAELEARGRTLITAEESCPNGFIDPGETNVIEFRIKNISGGDLKNIRAQIVTDTANDNNVALDLSGRQTVVGGTLAKDAEASVQLRFRADGPCGGSLTPRVRFTYRIGNSETDTTTTLSYDSFQLGATVLNTQSFSNSSQITINDFQDAADKKGRASPYPSTISVSGVSHRENANDLTGSRVVELSVTLHDVSHEFSKDIRALLVGPGNNPQKIVLMADAGGATAGVNAGVSGVTLTFSADASSGLPQNGQISSGTYRTSDYSGGATLPGTGSNATEVGGTRVTSLNAFDDKSPNGTWRLFVQDDSAGDDGEIQGGWTLNITSKRVECCGAGATVPIISHVDNGFVRPGIPNKTINEDTKFDSASSTFHTFQVSDIETTDADINISVSSSNESVITSSGIQVTKSGSNRTLKFQPIANQNGTATITVTATDGSGRSSSAQFVLTVTSVNDNPVISSIQGQAVNQGQTIGPVPFTVTDVETPASFLTLTASSSDEGVVSPNNVFFSGSGENRQVTIFPNSSSTSGTATITVRAEDPNGGVDTEAFVVDFSTAPGDPTITPLVNQSVDEDNAKTLTVTVRSNSTTSPSGLIVTGDSVGAGSEAIVPDANIAISGSGSTRTVVLTPAANANGTATIRLTVRDPGNGRTHSTTFNLVVNSINDRPTISSISDRTIAEDGNTGDIAYTVSDVETPLNELDIDVLSDNAGLVDPTQNVTFPDNTGDSRTIRITPKPDQFGKAQITVRVTDTSGANNASNNTTFVLTVSAVNDPPTVADVNGTTPSGHPDTAPVAITVPEDSNLNADGNPVEITSFTINGIRPGPNVPPPGNEAEQTVTVSVSSDNTTLIPSIRVDPTTADIDPSTDSVTDSTTLKFRTGKNQHGTATITLTLTDDAAVTPKTTTYNFKIAVSPVNDPPTMSNIANRTIPHGATATININPSDVETSTPNLNVTGAVVGGTNPGLVQDIVVDATKTLVTVLTQEGQLGTAQITITASDRGPTDNGSGPIQSISRTFTLTAANIRPPTISIVPTSGTIEEDSSASATVNIDDPNQNPAQPLDVTLDAVSDNPDLVPNENILFSPGSGLGPRTRTMVVVPAANKSGTATIRVSVTDDEGLTTSANFALTVTELPDAPSFSGISEGASFSAAEDASKVKTSDDKNLEVTVNDPDSSEVTVTAVSTDNKTLFPDANVSVVPQTAAPGTKREIVLQPAADQFGTANIRVTASDGARSTQLNFTVTINARNDEPTVALADSSNELTERTKNEDSGAIIVNLTNVTVGPENERGSQTIASITATARDKGSDPAVNTIVQSMNVDGSGTTRTLTITPIPNRHGTSEITLKVRDDGPSGSGNDNERELKFDVVFAEVNDTPTIAVAPADQNKLIPQGGSALVPFQIGDVEDPATALNVSATSSDQSVVSNANLELGGSGQFRSVLIRPTGFGSAVITLRVTDLGKESARGTDLKSATTTINVTVEPSNLPSITAIPNQTTNIGEPTDVITFNVSDAQTPSDLLNVSTTVTSGASLVQSIQFDPNLTGTERAFVVIPTSGQTGTATIQVRATDPEGNQATRTFTLTILGQPPTISSIQSPQIIQPGQVVGPLPFTVNDAETFPAFLAVTATSSNPAFVPEANVVIQKGSGGNRTVTVTPTPGASGSSTITLTVRDGENQTAITSFVVQTPQPTNTDPTIGPLPNQSVLVGQSTPVIPFTIGDAETPAASLTLTRTSSNQTLVPDANIFLGGTGANRTVFVTPASGQTGTATITITVSDGSRTASRSFTVTVSEDQPTDTPPTITAVSNQTTTPGTTIGPLAFTVGDAETAPGSLTVTPSTSNPAVVPINGIVLGGTGENRVISINPTSTEGTSTITLVVSDGTNSASTTFTVTVQGTQAPTISAIANRSTGPGQSTGPISFTVGDAETAAGSLTVTPSTSNPAIVPINNIVLGGTGANRVVTVNPTMTEGTVTITLTVRDAEGKTATRSFQLTVEEQVTPSLGLIKDFNNDQNTDLLLQHSDGSLGVWYMSGTTLQSAALLNPSNVGDMNWRVVASADFNGDGKPDVLFQHTDGSLALWRMDGARLASAEFISPASPGDAQWRVRGTGDFNGDGKADIVFQHTDGTLAVWYMDGRRLSSATLLSPNHPGDANWRLRGTGDFNGDGKPDLVFQHTSGTLAVWLMDGANLVSGRLLNPSAPGDATWRLVGTADFNRDGDSDLIFQNTQTNQAAVWLMDGTSMTSGQFLQFPGTGWQIVGL